VYAYLEFDFSLKNNNLTAGKYAYRPQTLVRAWRFFLSGFVLPPDQMAVNQSARAMLATP
jgi:hypothetical protein